MITDHTPSSRVVILNALLVGEGFRYGLGVWLERTTDVTCQNVTVASTTGGTGPHGWVDYVNGTYDTIVREGELGMSDFARNSLRPDVLADILLRDDQDEPEEPSQPILSKKGLIKPCLGCWSWCSCGRIPLFEMINPIASARLIDQVMDQSTRTAMTTL
eukprot:scaffold34656_cov178-Amphora_coffeaeformis.AAC.1